MDKARAAIGELTGKHGHTTEVDEQIRPAVTEEVVRPERLEETTTAVDREVHQHHHHTTVQPLEAREVLPEQHAHRMAEVQQKEFRHGDEGKDREFLERERGQFQDSSRTHETKYTTAQGQTVEGEHVHHHVHETVQPIVHKEVVQPEVIHTTVPIHETHYASTQHHGASTLPVKSLDEFTTQGGSLTGSSKTGIGGYDGVPKQYNQEFMNNPTEADRNPGQQGVEGPSSHHTGGTKLSGSDPYTDDAHLTHGRSGTTGTTGFNDNNTSSGLGSGTTRTGTTGFNDNNTSSGLDTSTTGGRYHDNSSSGLGTGSGTTSGVEREAERELGKTRGHLGGVHTGDNTAGSEISGQNEGDYASAKKPSLMDKLNPMKKT